MNMEKIGLEVTPLKQLELEGDSKSESQFGHSNLWPTPLEKAFSPKGRH
jgi:hypothetical protein